MLRLGFVLDASDKTKEVLRSAKQNFQNFRRDIKNQQGISAQAQQPAQRIQGSGAEPQRDAITGMNRNFFDPVRKKLEETFDKFQRKIEKMNPRNWFGGGQVTGTGKSDVGDGVGGGGLIAMLGKGGIIGTIAALVGGAALKMGERLASRYEQEQMQQVERSRLISGGGLRTGYAQYGMKAGEASRVDVMLAQMGGKGTRSVADLMATLNLDAETASVLQTAVGGRKGAGRGADLTRYFQGGGISRVESQLGMKTMSEMIRESIESGFNISSEKLASGVAGIYGLQVGGEQISATRASRIAETIDQGFKEASKLQGGVKQGAMFQAVYESMKVGGKAPDLVEVMKRVEEGATGENVKVLIDYVKRRFGTEQAGVLALKDILGLSTREADDIAKGRTEYKQTEAGKRFQAVQAPDVMQRNIEREKTAIEQGKTSADIKDTVERGMLKGTDAISTGFNEIAGLLTDIKEKLTGD